MEAYDRLQSILKDARTVLIIQADNPDADSLASALALELLMHQSNKEPVLYCGIDMPQYLRYLSGWDRVVKEVPHAFDASIIVDTSSQSLLGKLEESGARGRVAAKPVIVLDHHATASDSIPYATLIINDEQVVSTGELIFKLAKHAGWQITPAVANLIMTSILADSMGMTTNNTSADTYRIMAELVEAGANRPELEEARKAANRMVKDIFYYKAELIKRTEITEQGLALVTVPQQDINDYSPLYNPAPLIHGDHLMTENVRMSVVIKHYDSGRITAAIRCNQGYPLAARLAVAFGGGGHDYAAGFKLEKADLNEVLNKIRQTVRELIEESA